MNSQKSHNINDLKNDKISHLQNDSVLQIIKLSKMLMKLVEKSGFTEVIVKVKIEGYNN